MMNMIGVVLYADLTMTMIHSFHCIGSNVMLNNQRAEYRTPKNLSAAVLSAVCSIVLICKKITALTVKFINLSKSEWVILLCTCLYSVHAA